VDSESVHELVKALRAGQVPTAETLDVEEAWNRVYTQTCDLLRDGNLEAATEYAEACVALLPSLQDPRFRSFGHSLLALCLRATGRSAEALASIDLALEPPWGTGAHRSLLQMMKAELTAISGDPEGAAQYYRDEDVFALESGSPELIMHLVGMIALSYMRVGKPAEASRWFKRAIEIAERHTFIEAILGLIRDHAHCLMELGELPLALKQLARAKQIATVAGSVLEKGWIELDEGAILLQEGRLQEAEAVLKASMLSFSEVGRADGLFRARLNLANVLIGGGRIEQALAECERLLSDGTASDVLSAQARLLHCFTLAKLERWPEVESRLPGCRAAPQLDAREFALVDTLAADLALHKGDCAGAVALLQQAVKRYIASGLNREAGRTEIRITQAEYERGDEAAALAACERGLALLAESGEHDDVARLQQLRDDMVRKNLSDAVSVFERGPRGKAFQEVLERLRASGQVEAFLQLGIGQIEAAVRSGDLRRATRLAEELSTLALSTGNTLESAQCLHKLGVVLKNSGRWHEAAMYEEKALALYEQMGDHDWIAGVCMDLALAYKGSHEFAKALPLALRALEFFELRDKKEKLLLAHSNIGNILKESGRVDEGIEHLTKALHIAEQTRDLRSVAVVHANLGGAHILAGRGEDAFLAYRHAHTAAVACGDRRLAAQLQAALDGFGAESESHNVVSQRVSAILSARNVEAVRSLVADGDSGEQTLTTLLTTGKECLAAGRPDRARNYYKGAELVCQVLAAPTLSGRTFQDIGVSYAEQDDFKMALDYFAKAAACFDEAQQELDCAGCYTNAARASLMLGNQVTARRYADLAAAIHTTLRKPDLLAFDLVICGELELNGKNIPAAMSAFRQAADHMVESGSFTGVAMAVAAPALRALEQAGAIREVNELNEYCSLAGFRLLMNRWPEMDGTDARTRFLEANRELLLSEKFLTMFVRNLAPQAVSGGSVENARTLLEVGYHAAGLLGSEPLYLELLVSDADVSARIGDCERVSSLVSQIGARAKRLPDGHRKLKVYLDVVEVCQRIGDFGRCVEFHDHARTCAKELKDSTSEGRVLMRFGIACKNFGKLSEAVALHTEALTLAAGADDVVASIHVNLGNALEIIGDRQSAMEHYSAGMRLAQQINDPGTEVSCHIGLGIAAKNLGKLEDAAAHYQDALALCDRHSFRHQRELVVENIRVLEFTAKHNTEAIPAAGQSRHGQAARLNEIAAIESKKGNIEAAVKYEHEALEVFTSIGDPRGIAITTHNLASMYKRLGNLDSASVWGMRAIGSADQAGIRDLSIAARGTMGQILLADRVPGGLPKSMASAIKQVVPGGREASEPDHGRSVPDRSLCTQALKYFDEAIALVEEARKSLKSESDRMSLVERHKDIFDGAVMACMALNDTPRKIAYMEKSRAQTLLDLFETGRQRRLLQSIEHVPSSLPTGLGDADALTYDEVREVWRSWVIGGNDSDGPAVVLMFYFLTDDIYYIYVIDPSKQDGVSFRAIRMGRQSEESSDAITSAIQQFRAYLSRAMAALSEKELASGSAETIAVLEAEAASTMRLLYDLLVRPIEHLLEGYRRIVVVPHQKLHHVPFQALLDSSERSFVDKGIDVTYMLSLSSIKYCYHAVRKAAPEALLCMGDPTEDLPGAAAECQRIVQLYPHVVGGGPLLGKDATIAALRKYAPQAEVLHLAMHGEYDAKAPMNSSLRLADGPLTVYDVYGLDLAKTDTVVLSTCLSAMATVTNSDEVIGLIRGFFHAGASTVVASLWPVDSDPTARLMQLFHRRLREDPKRDKSRALREAMAETKAEYPLLLQWAPFCIYGRHD
jgi:tetratricopeptide (TPR) repeat protein